MTKNEALEILANAPRSNKPSKVNKQITEAQAFDIVYTFILSQQEGVLDKLTEKHVYQISRNQRRPKY